MIDNRTGDRIGALQWRGGVLCFCVTPDGHYGATLNGRPVAVMPDIRQAIAEEIRRENEKEAHLG